VARPVPYVLAGVNGAGKSSVGGHLLEHNGLTWFNPDGFARELKAETESSGANEQLQSMRISWFHMPVPPGRSDLAYFAVLGIDPLPHRAAPYRCIWMAGVLPPFTTVLGTLSFRTYGAVLTRCIWKCRAPGK
jgi:hypothetical protein